MDEKMFCFQCEQAANGCACVGNAGVCGKSAETADAQDALTGALIGFAELLVELGQPIQPPQALLLLEGLFTTITNVNFDPETVRQLTEKVWEAKNAAFATACPAPAPVGDYDMKQLWQEPDEDIRSLKSTVLFGLRGMAAYTYATSAVNGRPSLNYEAEVAQVGLVNYFVETNLDAFYSEVQSLLSQMQEDGAEATMLYIHWGTEYSLQADSSQRMIAQKMCDMGVDVIVGGHPHVVEPMELLTSSSDSRHKTAVIYSLGNAVSNQRRDLMTLNTGHTEDGAVFTVTFEKYADGRVYVADVNVMPTWVNLHSVDEKQEYNIVPLEDARRTEWQNLYGLDAAALANAVASYDRTMNIVGPGLEQCRSYYAQEKQARETPVVPTEEAA